MKPAGSSEVTAAAAAGRFAAVGSQNGGTSAEMNLKTVKLASTRYLDGLPSEGNDKGVAIRQEVADLQDALKDTAKSLAENNGDGTFTMPEWLAAEKGLI